MQQVLLLNSSFEPIQPVHTKSALRLLHLKKAVLVEGDVAKLVRSEKQAIAAPVVIRLVKYVNIPRRLTKRVINLFLFARDGYRCAYCGRHQDELGYRENLTRDHIQPRSRGGLDTWLNCVTACSKCNHLKSNKTLGEAGLKLRVTPSVPALVELRWKVRKLTSLQRKYVNQFYGSEVVSELEGRG